MGDKQNKNVDVLVYGSAIVDFICYVDRLPKAGETIHGHKFATGFGGKGANQCVASARLGCETAMIAKVGTDSWGADYIKHLQNQGVNVDYVKQCSGESTGVAQIAVNKGGENNIIIVAGANNYLGINDVEEAILIFKTAKVLLCQLETPLEGTLEALKSFEGTSILNAAPAMADTPKYLLKACSILCVNEIEAALMTQSQDIQNLNQAKTAVKQLLEMGASTVIITLGSQGAVYSENKDITKCIHVSANKVAEVVDTTGAGDAFLGALAYHLARYPQKELHQHIGFANLVASYSVQYPGTQSSFPKISSLQLNDLQKFPYSTI